MGIILLTIVRQFFSTKTYVISVAGKLQVDNGAAVAGGEHVEVVAFAVNLPKDLKRKIIITKLQSRFLSK